MGSGEEEKRPRLERLAPDLRCLVAGNPGPLTLDGTRTWVLGRERVVVVDPGPAAPGQLETLEETLAAGRVEAICLTHAHRDHAGCALSAAERLDAPLLASSRTLRRLGRPGGKALEEGDRVPVDGGDTALEALETPGHSRDHLCYLWHPRRTVLTGDLVLGEGSSLVVHPDGDVGAYLASLSRLLALRPRRLLPGHGPPVEDAMARLQEYRSHRLERHRQVREAVSAGARGLAELREKVYGPLPEGLRRPAELSTLAHLAHLRRQGDALPGALVDALEAAGGAPEECADPPVAEGRRGDEMETGEAAGRGTEYGERP